MGKLSQAELFKGTEPTGTALAKCYKAVPVTSDEFVLGKTSFDLSFDIEQYLEAGQDYVIRFKASVFRPAKKDGTKYDNARSQLFLIHFKGKEAQGLAVDEFSPSHESVLRTIKTVRATFNNEISFLGGNICLKEGENVHANATSVTLDDSDTKTLVIDFGEEIKIYNTHSYNLVIPAGSIAEKENQSVTNEKEISVGYYGASYYPLTPGRVWPANNSEISYFSNVTIPFKFPEGYNLGRNKSKIKLYSGSLENEPVVYECESSTDSKSIIAEIWKFDLQPSTTYYVVLEEGEVFPYEIDRPQVMLKDTSNPEIVLTYSTPAEIIRPDKVKIEITPSEGIDIERLDIVTFKLSDYRFEDTPYEVRVAVENPVAIFSDGTNETSLPLTFNANEKKATCEVNRALEAGKTYTLRIPAGTFAPSANANLAAVAANDELVYTFTGKAADSYTLTYAVEGQATLVTEVAPQAEVKVSFPENDGFKVASIAFNGEQQAVAESFTTPAIAQNSVLDIAYEYAGKIDYDFTTGVTAPEDCPFTVTSEGEMLVVEGVKAGDTIRIYTAGGLMMADLGAVPAGMSRASFRLATGQVYILLVNTTALKLRH